MGRAGPLGWVAAGVGVLLAHRFGLLNPLYDAFKRASEKAQTQVSISNIYGTAERVEAGGTPWFSELAEAMRKSTEWAYNAEEARRIEGEMREAERLYGPGSAYAASVEQGTRSILGGKWFGGLLDISQSGELLLPPLPTPAPSAPAPPLPAPLPISGPTFNPAPSDVLWVTQTLPGLFEVLFKGGEKRMVTTQDIATIPEAAALVAGQRSTTPGGLGSSFRVGSAYWAPGIGAGMWGVGYADGSAQYFNTQGEAERAAKGY